jgi:hypothetical protein
VLGTKGGSLVDEQKFRDLWEAFENLTTKQQLSVFPYLFGGFEGTLSGIENISLSKEEILNKLEKSINYANKK